MAVEYLCKCGRTFVRYNSLQKLCGHCQYNKYGKPKKPIKKMGKVARKWINTRQEWIALNPPPWACYICGKLLVIDTLTLDHVQSRSRHPELRFDLLNLKPCCWSCNSLKGSKSML